MAMMLFTGVSGLGVVFMVYVLVQFWNEGHRSKKPGTSDHLIKFSQEDRPTVIVVTRPISGGLQVADAPKPALWRRRVDPAPYKKNSHTVGKRS